MEDKVELRLTGIGGYAPQSGTYTLYLREVEGDRNLSITVGLAEGQATLMCLQGVRPPRPLTHDLFATMIAALGATLLRVLIYQVEKGVYYAYLYFRRENEILRVDARTSDAIALAVRAGAPILIYEALLHRLTGQAGKAKEAAPVVETLEEALAKAVANEDYEQAALLRDQIKERDAKPEEDSQ